MPISVQRSVSPPFTRESKFGTYLTFVSHLFYAHICPMFSFSTIHTRKQIRYISHLRFSSIVCPYLSNVLFLHHSHEEANSVHLSPSFLIYAHICLMFSFLEIFWYKFLFHYQACRISCPHRHLVIISLQMPPEDYSHWSTLLRQDMYFYWASSA
jgi:hypothetical protein